MAISWRKGKNIQPAILLDKIASARTINPDGRPAFGVFIVDDAMPALQSMLKFPDAAIDMRKHTLVWSALSAITGELTENTFIRAINDALSRQTSTQDTDFHVLTSISLPADGLFQTTSPGISPIGIKNNKYPRKYSIRETHIVNRKVPVEFAPPDYAKLVVRVKAKGPHEGISKALRLLDAKRGVWCILANRSMEIFGREWNPINVVRLGSTHTIHNSDGSIAAEEVWFEPNFNPTTIYQPADPVAFKRDINYIHRQLAKSNYSDTLNSTLVRYVRALDERDQNTAFLRLWSAFESLTTPNIAEYDKAIARTSFLYQDHAYHAQILEHLREYRNRSVHAGDQSERAKSHCYQLQGYFRRLFFFHLRNAPIFSTLMEANEFLDLSPDRNELKRRRILLNKAIRFVAPSKPSNSRNTTQ